MSADIEPRSIDLAQEPAFRLAGLEVHPATLEVVAGDRREQLEPRIMQVLVALARRRGEVVSRDELNELCWGGRVVGDDAVNRCIGRLRKMAQTYGGFTVETVPRVGYRLAEVAGRPWTRPLRGRRALAALMALAIVLALGAGLWAWRARQSVEDAAEPRIALMPFQPVGGGAESRAFAARLTDEVTGVLNAHVEGVASPSAGSGRPREEADLTLGGSVRREGDVLHVRAYIEDPRSKVTLWSRQYERPAAEEALLRTQVAVELGDTFQTAMRPFQQKGLKLDPRTFALYLTGVQGYKASIPTAFNAPLRGFEQIVARAPQFAAARGILALNLVHLSRDARPEDVVQLRRRARLEAEAAIRTDPSTADAAYDALYQLDRLEDPTDIAKAEDTLNRGLTPETEFAAGRMRRCQLLVEVGRARDSIRECERALALEPLAAPLGYRYARALAAAGEPDKAEQVIARSIRYRPDHLPSRRTLFEMKAFSGSADEALALLHDPRRPEDFESEETAALDLFLKARKSGASPDIDRAVKQLRATAEGGHMDPRHVVMGAAVLGRLDDAFAATDLPGLDVALTTIGAGYLFEPATAALRRDRRFWPIAARTGLIRYWRQRGAWPDFCSDPKLPYDCRKEAARVAGAQGRFFPSRAPSPR